MTNFDSREQPDLDLMMTCAYGAVREHFSHLTIEEIIDPPRNFADAYAAMHIATFIACEEFGISRRQVGSLQMRFKSAVFQSIMQVRERRQSVVFDRAYNRIASRALEIHAVEAGRLAA